MFNVNTTNIQLQNNENNIGNQILINNEIYYFRSEYYYGFWSAYGGSYYYSYFYIYKYNLQNNQLKEVYKINNSGYERGSISNYYTTFVYNNKNNSLYVIPGRGDNILEIDKYGGKFVRKIPQTSFTSTIKYVSQQIYKDKIYQLPYQQNEILEYDCQTKIIKLIPLPSSFDGTIGWTGTIVHPNGYIYGIPGVSNYILEFNPETYEFNFYEIDTDRQSSSIKWWGGILQQNNNIYQTPYNSNSILEFNPLTKKFEYYGNFTGNNKYMNGTIQLDLKTIIFSNYSTNSLLYFDTDLKYFDTININKSNFVEAIQQQDGKIYLIPKQNTNIISLEVNNWNDIQNNINSYIFDDFKNKYITNMILKKHNLFDQNSFINIRKTIYMDSIENIYQNNLTIELNIDNDVNNPYLYDIILLNLTDQNVEKLVYNPNLSTLQDKEFYYDFESKSIIFKQTYLENLLDRNKIYYLGVFTKGLSLFENVRTLSNLKKFVSNPESRTEDRTKIQKLYYINTEQGYQHHRVTIDIEDLNLISGQSKTWFKISEDQNEWFDPPYEIGTVDYLEKKEIYIKCEVDIDTPKGEYIDQLVVISKNRLLIED